MNFKKLFKDWKFLLLLFFLLCALVAIWPNPWNTGVSIKSVAKNSSAILAGIENPAEGTRPMDRERVLAINNIPVKDTQDYYNITSGFKPNLTVQIKTNKNTYRLLTREKIKETVLNETENVTTEETVQSNKTINGTVEVVNETINVTKEVPKVLREAIGTEDIGLRVDNAPMSNIKKGLDLQGGTRVLLKPEETISEETLQTLIDNLKERLNVYGLSDIAVSEVSTDMLGNEKLILVEMAGASEEEVKDLLSKQGKFEAKIANRTVFKGGQDITYVCRTAQCSGLDSRRGCGKSSNGYSCAFTFQISLSPTAAQNFAQDTKDLEVTTLQDGRYLKDQIILYLDDQEVDKLNVAADLQGKAATDISISGGGSAPTQQGAITDALNNMKRLQTILVTGSLPTKLDIIRTDTISPTLGSKFIANAWYMGLLAALAVAIVLVIAYRKLALAVPILITVLAEIVIILGFAAGVNWNLDLSSIAGIVATIGTGVDAQIIITDEVLRKGLHEHANWKDKLKNAFFVIFSSFATLTVAMLPLYFAGAGLLRGFAITTIVGVVIGVFVTRPAYSAFLKALFEE